MTSRTSVESKKITKLDDLAGDGKEGSVNCAQGNAGRQGSL